MLMSLIPTPTSIEAAPAESRPLLEAVNKQIGRVPNLFRLVGVSPASLEAYLGMNGALGKGTLDVRTRERIALAVAEINDCGYCLSAHSYFGKNLAKLSDDEILANRNGGSADVKADAAVRFAAQLANARGQVGDDAVQAVRQAGYTDAQIIEIIAHVAINTFTNYVNESLKTEIDFPVVSRRAAA
jgi:uncharacterized peroxidase-related enzyme